MCLIDYTSGRPMLHVYLIVIPYIIYVECYLHDKTPLFYFGLTILQPVLYDHSLSYSLCSSLNFLDKDLVEPNTKQVLEDGQ